MAPFQRFCAACICALILGAQGCALFEGPRLPAVPSAPVVTAPAPIPPTGTVPAPVPGPKPTQGERVEAASELWGALGIGAGVLAVIASIILRFWMAALAPVFDKLTIAGGIILAASITIWTIAPQMIWLFRAVAFSSLGAVVCACVYAVRRYVLTHEKPEHPAAL